MLSRIVRFPFWFVNFVIGGYGVFFIIASAATGVWLGAALKKVGLQPTDGFLVIAGPLAYSLLGVVLPVTIGYRLVGWPAFVLAPILSLAVVGWLDRWFSSK